MRDKNYKTTFIICSIALLVLLACLKRKAPESPRVVGSVVKKFVIPGTLGVTSHGCNNLSFYGSTTKKFGTGKATARIITNGATIRTKPFDAHIINGTETGLGFEAYFHTFNIKQGDVVDIQAVITADDGETQHISKVFVVGEDACDTVSDKNRIYQLY